MSIEIDSRGVSIVVRMEKEREYLEMKLQGKLHHRDYEVMIPVVERAIEAAGEKELDLLVDMRDFEGWSFEAALDDLRFGLKIKDKFQKIAVVGNKKWEEISVDLFRHLSKGEMRFFESMDEARNWILS